MAGDRHALQNLDADEVPAALSPILFVQGAVEKVLRKVAVVGRTILHLGAAVGAVDQKQLEAKVAALWQEIEVQARQNENIEKFIQTAQKYKKFLRKVAVVGRTILHLGAAVGAVDQTGEDTAPAGAGHAVPLLTDHLDFLKYIILNDALMGVGEG